MLENSWDFASDYMWLREIILFPEKVEKLHSQYNGLRKVKWNSTYARVSRKKLCTCIKKKIMHVYQEKIPDTERVIDFYAGQNGRLNFT